MSLTLIASLFLNIVAMIWVIKQQLAMRATQKPAESAMHAYLRETVRSAEFRALLDDADLPAKPPKKDLHVAH